MQLRQAERNRLRGFLGNTRLLVVLIAGGVIAAVVVYGILLTSARFTDVSKSSANDLSTGEANLEVSPAGQIVDAEAMTLGDVRRGDVTVTNRGSRALLSVTVKGAASAPAVADAVRLKITDRDPPSVERYNGTLGAAGRIELGTYGKGAQGAWTIQLALPSTTDPSLSGKRLDAAFDWEARTP